MAKSRFTEESSCTGKVRYSTRDDSVAAALALRARGRGKDPKSYHCPFCDGWHTSSNRRASAIRKLHRTVRCATLLNEKEKKKAKTQAEKAKAEPEVQTQSRLPPPVPAVTNLGSLLQEVIQHA